MKIFYAFLVVLVGCSVESVSPSATMAGEADTSGQPQVDPCDDGDPTTDDLWHTPAAGSPDQPQCIHGKNALAGTLSERVAAAKVGDWIAAGNGYCDTTEELCESVSISDHRTGTPVMPGWMQIVMLLDGTKATSCSGHHFSKSVSCPSGQMCQQNQDNTITCNPIVSSAPATIFCIDLAEKVQATTVVSCNFTGSRVEDDCPDISSYVAWQPTLTDGDGTRWCTIISADAKHTHVRLGVSPGIMEYFTSWFMSEKAGATEVAQQLSFSDMPACGELNGYTYTPLTTTCKASKLSAFILNW